MRLMASARAIAGVVTGQRLTRPLHRRLDVGVRPTLSALSDTCTMGRLLSVLHNRSLHRRAGQAILHQLPTAATAPVCS
jgi:hypothetical protein